MPRTTTGMLHVPLPLLPIPPRLPPPAHAFRVRICFAIVNNSDACFYYSIKHPRVPGGAVNHPRATGLPLYLSLSCFSAANNLHYVALLGCASFDYRGAWDLCKTPCSFLVSDETAGGMTPILVAITPPPLKKVHKKISA